MSASAFLVELLNSKPVFAALALVTHNSLHTAEWDILAHVIISSWMLFFGTCAAAEYLLDKRVHSLGEAVRYTSVPMGVYFGTLVTSILIHRGFFHRLGKVILPIHTISDSFS